MNSNLLIVGGTGFIGKALALEAIKRGYIVTIISLLKCHDVHRIPKCTYISVDITDFNLLEAKLKNNSFNYVVNLAGYVDHGGFRKSGNSVINTHLVGLINIIRVLNPKSLIRFVQIGSSDEYGSNTAPQLEKMREAPFTPYSFAKASCTHLIQMLSRAENFPGVILRFFLVYGPGQASNRFIPQVINSFLSNSKVTLSTCNQIRDFCYVTDIINGIFKVLPRNDVNGEVFNIASGKPLQLKTIVDQLKAAIGKGIPQFGVHEIRNGENLSLYADISKAKSILNWSPTITINDGLFRCIEFYRRKLKTS